MAAIDPGNAAEYNANAQNFFNLYLQQVHGVWILSLACPPVTVRTCPSAGEAPALRGGTVG
jgi:hypothetical protein